MKRIWVIATALTLIFWTATLAAEKIVETKGKEFISKVPPFTLTLPTEFRLVHSSSQDFPKENSRTRVYFLIKENNKQAEELLIVQVAEKTNPQAEPITAPPLKPLSEERMYSQGREKKGETEIDYLLQLMQWSPEAPSLQSLIKGGIVIPSHWALQGLCLFICDLERAVLIRYSKDVHSFGLKVSDRAEMWRKGSLTGNEKKAVEIFQKSFMGMIDSIRFKRS